jgi:DNA modification methylase
MAQPIFPPYKKVKLSALTPYAKNSRTHSPEQVAQIAASIKEFGFTNPVLVADDGSIIAGHGRVLAAELLGLKEVPAIELSGLSEDQRKAYIIADNKLALNAGWDLDLLKSELGGLAESGFDLTLTGFSDLELADIFAVKTSGLTDPDEVPDEVENAVAELGDVWLLGAHRIACGDATNAEHVEKLLAGAEPHLMVTDPPYGVSYDANWRNETYLSDGTPIGAKAVAPVMNDGQSDWREAWSLFRGEVAYIWHADVHSPVVSESLASCGFQMRALVVWVKSRAPISRGHYHHRHEPCWYAVRKGGTGHWQGDRKQNTAWEIDTPRASETGHSTQKPVECMARPIRNNSKLGDGIYEPFSGSGTTIIACEAEGRVCFALEIHPPYVDMAIQRWQNFTGQKATREADGKSYDECRAALTTGGLR